MVYATRWTWTKNIHLSRPAKTGWYSCNPPSAINPTDQIHPVPALHSTFLKRDKSFWHEVACLFLLALSESARKKNAKRSAQGNAPSTLQTTANRIMKTLHHIHAYLMEGLPVELRCTRMFQVTDTPHLGLSRRGFVLTSTDRGKNLPITEPC